MNWQLCLLAILIGAIGFLIEIDNNYIIYGIAVIVLLLGFFLTKEPGDNSPMLKFLNFLVWVSVIIVVGLTILKYVY